MVTDALVRLEQRGLLLDRAEATYAWGGDGLAALSAGGRLRLVPSDESHDVTAVAEGDDGIFHAELVTDAGAHGTTVGLR